MEFVKVAETKIEHYKGKVYDLNIGCADHTYKINDFTVHNCGSLLAGCLGITKLCIDPIKLNLYFDRFISEQRLPDAIYRYNIKDAELIRNNETTFEELKTFCAKKLSEYPQYKDRLIKELYRARLAYDNGINMIDTIKSFKDNLSNAYVLPYLFGLTDKVDLEKPVEIQSLGLGSSGLDIDSDISGRGKDKVFNYLQEKYGKESVCYIGTYTEEGIKPAVKDILRSEGVPFKDSNNFCAAIPEETENWEEIIEYIKNNNPAEYETYLRYKNKLDYVPKLQHFIRSTGCHPGGQIIFNKPVYEYVPVIRNKGEIATAWVENGANTILDEFAGVIKYDVLGLNTLDIIDDCIDSINEELIMIEDDDGKIKIVPLSYIEGKI